ncbi:hypothetical protein ACP4OV_002284 [Aristida adscensionis]
MMANRYCTREWRRPDGECRRSRPATTAICPSPSSASLLRRGFTHDLPACSAPSRGGASRPSRPELWAAARPSRRRHRQGVRRNAAPATRGAGPSPSAFSPTSCGHYPVSLAYFKLKRTAMADVVGGVEKIVGLALKIKEAVETVRQNKRECRDIEQCAARVSALLRRLHETTPAMRDDEAMRGALEDLAGSLESALGLVTECQRKSRLRRFLTAGEMAKELDRVQNDIVQKLALGNFATNVQASIMLNNIHSAVAAAAPPTLPPQPQDAELVGITHTIHSTDAARCEMKTTVARGSRLPDASLSGIAEFSLSELKEATNDFSEQNIIGRGGLATVYKGLLRDGQAVSIKKINISPGFVKKHLFDEVEIILNVQHKNIVKRLGYCREVETRSILWQGSYIKAEEWYFCFVEEYLPNGSLEIINKGSSIDWSSRFRIIQGIAHGLHFLHEQRIVHMDVKPANILLDSDMNPKISDFGLATMLDRGDDEITRGNSLRGTMGYLAPEYLAYGLLSTRCDVYGFGIVLLMIMRGMCRSESARHQSLVKWLPEAQGVGAMKNLLDPSLYEECQLMEIQRCIEIGLLCTQIDRAARPTMVDVVQMLNGEKELPALKKPRYI